MLNNPEGILTQIERRLQLARDSLKGGDYAHASQMLNEAQACSEEPELLSNLCTTPWFNIVRVQRSLASSSALNQVLDDLEKALSEIHKLRRRKK